MTSQEMFDALGEAFAEKIQDKTEFRGETTYTIAGGDLHQIAKFCRDELSFDYLLDITSIDNFEQIIEREIVATEFGDLMQITRSEEHTSELQSLPNIV